MGMLKHKTGGVFVSQTVESSSAAVIPVVWAPVNENKVFTNLGAAEGTTNISTIVDWTNATEVRCQLRQNNTNGFAGSVIRVKYATTPFSSFTAITGSDLSLSAAAFAFADSGWLTIPVGARDRVNLVLHTQGGDGVVDPNILFYSLYWR